MDVQRAAYGLRIEGIDGHGALALRGAAGWPVLSVRTGVQTRTGPRRIEVARDRASIDTPAARLVLRREPRELTVLASDRLPDADLVHPCLWPAAAVLARWRGLETVHGGAFVDARGRAWAVLGERHVGKSSLLASLALAGHDVLADDLLVLDGCHCLGGPRCLDLRPEAADHLGLTGLADVRSSGRRRLVLAPGQARVPLGGCVYLEWGAPIAVEPVPPAEHLGLLTGQRRIAGLGANIEQLLDLSGLPAFRMRRPRAWSGLHGATAALLEAAGDSYFSPTLGPPART